MSKEDMEKLVPIILEHNLAVISDEIYCELTYEGEHTSIASLPGMWERTIVLNGFSKAYAMTGWRIGYAAAPEPLISAMMKIHQFTMLCAPIMSQKAALEALRNGEEEMKKMIQSYYKEETSLLMG